MASVRVISTSTIKAATHSGDSTLKIELNPWDLQWFLLNYIQKGLLFHNPKDKGTVIQHLKQSLSSTLDFFPPIAGRLDVIQHEDDTSFVSIICNNSGALFVHAVAEQTSVADILESIYVPRIVHSFFPINKAKHYEGTSKPLLAVQVTELVDGIFIGCTMSHIVADGASFWHFINSWAEISRGLDKISKAPVFERWCLDGIDRPIRLPAFTKEIPVSDEPVSQLPPERVFHFTKEKLAQLKAKANAETKSNKISSLQALLTHIWRSVIRNQRLDAQQEVHYKVIIGARPRFQTTPIADNYFGNAVKDGTVTMKAGELLEGGIGKAAWEMNKMISLHTEEFLKRQYESWAKNPKLSSGSKFFSNTLTTSSSPRFDFYGNDFGWGKPVAVRSGPGNKTYGKITLFAGAEEEGSIDVEVCFQREILEAMGNDPEFMHAVSF